MVVEKRESWWLLIGKAMTSGTRPARETKCFIWIGINSEREWQCSGDQTKNQRKLIYHRYCIPRFEPAEPNIPCTGLVLP